MSNKNILEVEGNRYESKLLKYSGEPKLYSSESKGNGITGYHLDIPGLFKYGFESGRTIELKRFEFCRVKIYLSVSYKNTNDYEYVKKAVKNFVLEMLMREEFGLDEKDYRPKFNEDTINIINNCINRRLLVSYGLTLKSAKKYESHQVDILEEIPISNGVDGLKFFEEFSDRIASDISGEYSRIKSFENETGL